MRCFLCRKFDNCMAKLSLTYRFLRFIGLNYSEEEYGNVSLLRVIR